MPKPVRYFTFRELFDRLPTTEELVDIIKGLNAFHTVLLTSRLSAMFRYATWSRNPKDAGIFGKFQYWLASAFLDLDTKQRLESRFGAQNPVDRPVFHPLQFLSVMRLALSSAEGDEIARPDTSEPHRCQFGTACLMVSDLFLTEEEQQSLKAGSFDDRRKQLMLQSVASVEISNPTPIRNLFFRSYAMYRIVLRDPEFLRMINKDCGLDIEREFETQFGVSLTGWLSLVFAAQWILLSRTQEDFLNRPETLLINSKLMLQDSTLTESQIDGFFDMLSMTFDDLRAEIRKERPVDKRLDLVPFKSRPFVLVSPHTYACLDFGLVTDKMHNGPYFLLSNKLPESERWRMFNAWGLLFEAYVNWLLKGLHARNSARLYPDTRWEDGRKSFDAVFIKSRVVAVMEHKGGFLRQDARYSNDLQKFLADLMDKMGKGCKQLARDIGALFPKDGAPKKLTGVPVPSNALYVMPVLVVQDPILRSPFVNYFLNQSFQSERSHFSIKNSVIVLPLNVVHITDLENLVEMAEAFDLDVLSILHRRCNANHEMLLEMPDVLGAIPDTRKDLHSVRFQEIWKKWNDEMSGILFKEPQEQECRDPSTTHADS